MEIKKFTSNITNFIIKRVIELFGMVLIILSILLFGALLTYSPQDPNFVFSNNNNINNILGFKGSIVSDFFLQSIGLISFLVSLTIFFTGTNIIIKKKILIILENLFFTIIYSIVGTLFLTFYYKNSFWLAINGNGGFVGKFISNSFLKSLIIFDEKICYYLLIIITLFLFLVSVNFNLKFFLNFFKKMLNFKIKDKNTKESNYENFSAEKNDILNDATRIQENFSFEQNLKSRNNQKNKIQTSFS